MLKFRSVVVRPDGHDNRSRLLAAVCRASVLVDSPGAVLLLEKKPINL